jgi:hypothetical protein
MPADIAAPIAEPWLEHKHKFRREMAYRIFRGAGVPPEFDPRLLAAFKKNGDQQCLELVARYPAAVAATDHTVLAEKNIGRCGSFSLCLSLTSSGEYRSVAHIDASSYGHQADRET